MFNNLILNSDSYKYSHPYQYPEGTEVVYSYIESRGGAHNQIMMAGLQAYIKAYLLKPITLEDIDEAEALITAHGEPFYREGWEYILKEYGGKLPVRIRAVREGTIVPTKNVMLTIENTDPKCFWLTSFLETSLLRAVWYPSTVATVSYECKQIIHKWLVDTGDVSFLGFKLHDFGARGVSSLESASLGGLAHLFNFMGTDTVSALIAARKWYGEAVAGFSIPAAEHSTMTILGKEGEFKQMRRMVEKFAGPNKLYACVSDSYDIYNATGNGWGSELKDLVINSGGTLVVRPDSGDPATVVTKIVKILDEKFGSTINKKGFKVLHPSVRVIQGDGINSHSINTICMMLAGNGYSTDNIAFGMGGALLQHMDRDTCKWAMKCSAAKINGEWVDVFKDPITDPGKTSKKGRLSLVAKNGIHTVTDYDLLDEDNLLELIYENGDLLIDEKLSEIRVRANKYFE